MLFYCLKPSAEPRPSYFVRIQFPCQSESMERGAPIIYCLPVSTSFCNHQWQQPLSLCICFSVTRTYLLCHTCTLSCRRVVVCMQQILQPPCGTCIKPLIKLCCCFYPLRLLKSSLLYLGRSRSIISLSLFSKACSSTTSSGSTLLMIKNIYLSTEHEITPLFFLSMVLFQDEEPYHVGENGFKCDRGQKLT